MKKKDKNSKLVKEIVENYVDKESLKSDPNGSYTGKGTDKNEKPVQDADDL